MQSCNNSVHSTDRHFHCNTRQVSAINSTSHGYHQVHTSTITNCQEFIKDINKHCNNYDTASHVFISDIRTTNHADHLSTDTPINCKKVNKQMY